MSSSFSHSEDHFLRPGDSVVSVQGDRLHANRFLLDVSQQQSSDTHLFSSPGIHNPNFSPHNRRYSSSLLQTRKNSTTSRSIGSSRGCSPPSSHPMGASNVNPVAQLFGVDVSSVEAWWNTMTDGTWLKNEVVESIVGVIEGIDVKEKTAKVTVWKRGKKLLTQLPNKPVEVHPLCHLRKVSKKDFMKECKRPYLDRLSVNLKLRGEGMDDAVPPALVAYNNIVVAGIMRGVDTTSRLTTKDVEKARPWGPTALKEKPLYVPVAVEDPFGDKREALQSSGYLSRHSKVFGARPQTTKEVSTGPTPSAGVSVTTSAEPSSFCDQNLSSFVHGRLHNARTSIPSMVSPTTTASTTKSRRFSSVQQPPPTSESITDVFTIVAIRPRDNLVQLESRDVHVTCSLSFVRMWAALPMSASAQQQSTFEGEVQAAIDEARTCRVRYEHLRMNQAGLSEGLLHCVDGDKDGLLQEKLFARGVATVFVDDVERLLHSNTAAPSVLVESSSVDFNTTSSRQCSASTSASTLEFQRNTKRSQNIVTRYLPQLYSAQSTAAVNRLGRWALGEKAHQNFLPQDPREPMTLDLNVQESGVMSSLFPTYQSSENFLNKFRAMASS